MQSIQHPHHLRLNNQISLRFYIWKMPYAYSNGLTCSSTRGRTTSLYISKSTPSNWLNTCRFFPTCHRIEHWLVLNILSCLSHHWLFLSSWTEPNSFTQEKMLKYFCLGFSHWCGVNRPGEFPGRHGLLTKSRSSLLSFSRFSLSRTGPWKPHKRSQHLSKLMPVLWKTVFWVICTSQKVILKPITFKPDAASAPTTCSSLWNSEVQTPLHPWHYHPPCETQPDTWEDDM
jgi:hypothetical protein